MFKTLIYISLLMGSLLSGQQQHLDSLEKAFSQEKNLEKKVFLLYELSDEWSYYDTIQSFKKLHQAKNLAQNNAYFLAFEPFYRAQIIFTNDIETSKKLYQKSIERLQKYDTQKALTILNRAWHNYAIMYQWEGNHSRFLEILLDEAIPVSKKLKDKNYLAQNYGDVGLSYWNSKDYKQSINYYQLAINTLKNVEESYQKNRRFIEFYTYIGQSYIYINEQEKTIKYLDSAHNYYHHPAVDPSFKVDYQIIRAKTYEVEGNYAPALLHIDSGFAALQNQSGNFDFYKRKLMYEKAFVLYKLNRFDESLIYINEALTDTALLSVRNVVQHIRLKSEIEAALGDFEAAYRSSVKLNELSDSLYATQDKVKINDLVLKYETAEKENAILSLEGKNRLQRVLLGSAIIIAFLTALYFWSLLRQRNKREKQRLELFEKEKEIEVNNALIAGEEQERLRLARDLHDGIGGTLTGIKINLENSIQNPQQSDITKSVDLLENAIHNLRLTSHNLAPENLMKYGLEEALNDFCQKMNSPQLKCTIYTSGLGEIKENRIRLLLYRIAQELITNVVKHANATEILLQATLENNLLLLSVEDNGSGFDPAKNPRNMGLNNVEKRVELLGGNVQIESTPGTGTSVNIEIQL